MNRKPNGGHTRDSNQKHCCSAKLTLESLCCQQNQSVPKTAFFLIHHFKRNRGRGAGGGVCVWWAHNAERVLGQRCPRACAHDGRSRVLRMSSRYKSSQVCSWSSYTEQCFPRPLLSEWGPLCTPALSHRALTQTAVPQARGTHTPAGVWCSSLWTVAAQRSEAYISVKYIQLNLNTIQMQRLPFVCLEISSSHHVMFLQSA